MKELSDKGISYSAGFFMLIALAIGGIMVGSFLSIPIIMLMSGKSITAIQDIMGNPAYFRELQVMQSISAIFGFLLPTIFGAALLSKRPFKLIGFTGKPSIREVLLTIGIIALGLALNGALAYLSYQIPFPTYLQEFFTRLENNYLETAANIINLDNPFELFVSIIVLGLLPAVCEETLFRGGLQNYLYRSTHKFWLSILVVSFIFSIVHFSAYGFLSRFFLGIVLGLLYQYSGKLWLPIIAHFINNATAIVVMYVQKSNGKTMAELMSDKDGSYWGLLSIPFIILLFVRFRHITNKTKTINGI
ncbi:MAG: type II CAAX prenyl endopeptidase Rce1 family protein [Niabella sp.]